MAKTGDYIFVLWGKGFEEVVAAIFVTRLREAGLRVKIVGLTPRRISGSHGLALVPDLTLDQALSLAAQVICLMIPYSAYGLKQLKHDPRVRDLFNQALANQARLVVAQLNETDLAGLGLLPAPAGAQLMTYLHNYIELIEFAGRLAELLL